MGSMDNSDDIVTRFDNIMENFGKNFDAQLAILVAAKLEESLKEALLTKMRPINHEIKKRLFEGYGPLSGFAAKIDLAYALKIFPKKVYDTLRTLKKVRDIFAHRSELSNFETPEIATLLNTLQLDKSFTSMKARYGMKLVELNGELAKVITPPASGEIS
jgi:DNA-binding MltR family transcriptional regulator